MIVSQVRFEHHDRPFGIGTPSPRLSWQVRDADPDWAQTAYEVELDGAATVRVDSAEQVLVPWPFPPLTARGTATVRVRVASGPEWSEWAEPSTVELGLLGPEDWTGRFVSPHGIGGVGEPAPVLSRTVTLRPGIARARLYVTAHGLYDATLNGQRVGDQVLTPGWTSYPHRLRYQTFDVTDLLVAGENRLEVLLGNGWYRGRLGWFDDRALYGTRLALLAQLEVGYPDGSVEVVGTDERWSAHESGVLADDLYDGQRTDLRPRPSIVDTVEVLDEDLGRLVAPDGPPVRVTEVVAAVRVWTAPSGRTLVDFGQNVVGVVRLRLRDTRAGEEVTVRHAEVLDGGEVCVRTLRSAKAVDSYVLADAAEAVLEPALTFHGFRYAEVTGVPGLAAADVEAVVFGSDLRRTGWFSCSDPDLTRFHENVVWTMRGNFLDVPTDCPQRDERLGWAGDCQLFAPSACFLFDTAGFFTSWLADLAADQYPDGAVPCTVPDPLRSDKTSVAGWGDAATVVPWTVYQRFGDTGLLARQFASMRAWVDNIAARTTDGVVAGGFQFGDWLDPTAPPDNPLAATSDPEVLATAYLVRSADLVAAAARELGHDADAGRYAALAARTRAAFARAYVTGAGRVLSDTPSVYALALSWDLLPTDGQREHAVRRLADLLRVNGYRISTGLLGTPVLTDALTAAGRADLAYRLLLQRECPSWLYSVTMGATTVWERWDSMLPDGSINPGEMTSFNHYALGAVADWLHRTVAGLAPAAPGYREITVAPVPHAALTHASARHDTPYGEASVAWRRADGLLTVDVVVPPGARASVQLPGAERVDVRHGRHTWTVADPCVAANGGSLASVRELIDSADRWPVAAEILVRHGVGRDLAEAARQSARHLGVAPADLPAAVLYKDFDGRGEKARQELDAALRGEPAPRP
ncbi:glycoside hydrolase family 78 protein [Actinophytocola sp.]|uniref:glycoside hydrolase family 78 protein n=1 Tax=Actinophytocola sp. TaxID=1872138 RepID=UPI002EDAF1C5